MLVSTLYLRETMIYFSNINKVYNACFTFVLDIFSEGFSVTQFLVYRNFRRSRFFVPGAFHELRQKSSFGLYVGHGPFPTLYRVHDKRKDILTQTVYHRKHVIQIDKALNKQVKIFVIFKIRAFSYFLFIIIYFIIFSDITVNEDTVINMD